MGTFDHALSLSWTAFHREFVFVGDPFPSTRSDEEQESRLMAFCKLLSLNVRSFERFLENDQVQIYWLSGARYRRKSRSGLGTAGWFQSDESSIPFLGFVSVRVCWPCGAKPDGRSLARRFGDGLRVCECSDGSQHPAELKQNRPRGPLMLDEFCVGLRSGNLGAE